MKRAIAASDARWRRLWDEHDKRLTEHDRKMAELDRQEAKYHDDWEKQAAIYFKKVDATGKLLLAGMKMRDGTRREFDFKINALIDAQTHSEEEHRREMAELRRLWDAWLRRGSNGHSKPPST